MSLFSRIPVDKKRIEAAITALERQSSAELRVYIERKIPRTDQPLTGLQRALQVFSQLEMEKTQARNGVLIYLAYQDHQCSIIGDCGIDQFVSAQFWQTQCDDMIREFKQKKFTEGICLAIARIGKELALHFPVRSDDQNELSNEVIIND
ncbi:TPM domain-containing protein [Pasteurellaceae bacterium LIM206]|nr:TPM domain-containing protein [Pasteurellaceae bacterium LIM206]